MTRSHSRLCYDYTLHTNEHLDCRRWFLGGMVSAKAVTMDTIFFDHDATMLKQVCQEEVCKCCHVDACNIGRAACGSKGYELTQATPLGGRPCFRAH